MRKWEKKKRWKGGWRINRDKKENWVEANLQKKLIIKMINEDKIYNR